MKKLNRKVLDKCIEMTRQYWQGEADSSKFLLERIELAKESGIDWTALLNLLDGIFAGFGFNPEASNWNIYCVLQMLGWEVADEVETSESL